MAAVDPFTQAYQAILAALRAHKGVTDVVRVNGTRFVDMTDPKFQTLKGTVQAADLPEIILDQTSWSGSPFGGDGGSSTAAGFSQTYRLICTFDTLQLLPANKLKWETYRALLFAGTDLGLRGLVRKWNLIGADDTFGQKDWKRDTDRVVTVAGITVSMYVPKNQLY